MRIVASFVFTAILCACANSPDATHAQAPPPSENEGIVRLITSGGAVAAEIVLNKNAIERDEIIQFKLVNRGELPILTGILFHVEWWNGTAWDRVQPSKRALGQAVGIKLQPAQASKPQTWPGTQTQQTIPGWYRVVKRATYEDPLHKKDDLTLVMRQRFQVRN